ncbi:MAG: ChrR family anti-sigma-E factor [Alphaproteobacteria bacterium]
MVTHHPTPDLLSDYAAGMKDEPTSLLLATHLALCPTCRQEVNRDERIFGSMLESLEPEPLSDDALSRVMAELEAEPTGSALAESKTPASEGAPLLPQPLRGYLGEQLTDRLWRGRGALSIIELLENFPGVKTRMLRIGAGAAMPRHSHHGSELTLVLAGGFADASGHYVRGDVAIADPSVDHQPVADAGEDCICLAVTDAPLRLTGPIGRVVNPLFRF